jgi:hypothetical protein
VSDFGVFYAVDCTVSTITLTIDAQSSMNEGILTVMKIDGSTNPVIILPGIGQTINGLTQLILPNKHNTIQILSDGTFDYKIIGSILGAPDVNASSNSLVLRSSVGDINANNINGQFFSSNVDAITGNNIPRLSQVLSLLSTSVNNTDNSSIYVNNSSKLAVKPNGISDSLISGQSSILLNFSIGNTYSAGQCVIFNGYVWVCLSSSNTAPSNTSAQWRPVCGLTTARDSYSTVYSNTNYTATENDCYILMDCHVANLTITINQLTGFTGAGSSGVIPCLSIIKTDAINILTIQLSGSDTFLDGSTFITTGNQGALIKLFAIKDLNKWLVKVL